MQSAGEGEHKALEFIRKKSLEPGFDTNTSICIYSPDSDLIFLGLSTHLKHLCLFREARWSNGNENFLRAFEREIKETKYDFVWVSLIRDYFELEYREVKKDIGKVFDLERVIDDFIFVFFFIGNDFVPGMLSLEERELNFDNLINSLKDNIIDLKDYITKNGEIIWPNAVKFFRKFARKHVDLALLDNKIKSEEEEKEINSELNLKKTESTLSLTMSLSLSKADSRSSIQELDKSFILQVRSLCKSNPALAKEYYYTEKFKIDIAQNPEEYKKIVKSYLEGIQFLLKYYYKGCPSYSWFYPYHFPPLIIDLLDVKFVTEIVSSDFLNFEVGEPYDPFHHLITTVPIKEMTDLLPDSITCIITDKDSILNSFYPEKFELDCFGARYEKGYIPIIPIIPHEILLEKYSSVKNSPNLTEEEKKRNIPQPIFLFQWDESMENETLAPLNKYYDEIETKAKMSNFDLKGIQQDFQSDNKMTGSGNCFKSFDYRAI